MQRFLGIFLILVLIPPALRSAPDDFTHWSDSQCSSIIDKASASGNELRRSVLSKALSRNRNLASGLWITKPVSLAIGRKVQLEERGPAERAEKVSRSIYQADKYSFVIILVGVRVSPYSGAYLKANSPDRLSKIFLEDAEDNSKFVRAVSIELAPLEVGEAVGSPAGEIFVLRFARLSDDGAALLRNPSTQKIRLQLPTADGTFRFEYKLSEFGPPSIEDY